MSTFYTIRLKSTHREVTVEKKTNLLTLESLYPTYTADSVGEAQQTINDLSKWSPEYQAFARNRWEIVTYTRDEKGILHST